MEGEFVLDDLKRKLRIEQAVRDFLHVLEEQQLTFEEGLVAWNMLGFTMFQELYPEDPHEETQRKMLEFSQNLFAHRRPLS